MSQKLSLNFFPISDRFCHIWYIAFCNLEPPKPHNQLSVYWSGQTRPAMAGSTAARAAGCWASSGYCRPCMVGLLQDLADGNSFWPTMVDLVAKFGSQPVVCRWRLGFLFPIWLNIGRYCNQTIQIDMGAERVGISSLIYKILNIYGYYRSKLNSLYDHASHWMLHSHPYSIVI